MALLTQVMFVSKQKTRTFKGVLSFRIFRLPITEGFKFKIIKPTKASFREKV